MQADNQGLNTKTHCLSIAYLGQIEYYAILANSSKILLEQHESYIKQSYRNRCSIATANGIMNLTIPVEKHTKSKAIIKDVRISYHGNWNEQHWKSIESAYNSSPFFRYYEDELRAIYNKRWIFLWDFNLALQQKALELLDVEPIIQCTDKYEKECPDPYIDLRDRIHPKNEMYLKGLKPYYQVFINKHNFTPNLSIIDLLMNMGNESIMILKNSNQ